LGFLVRIPPDLVKHFRSSTAPIEFYAEFVLRSSGSHFVVSERRRCSTSLGRCWLSGEEVSLFGTLLFRGFGWRLFVEVCTGKLWWIVSEVCGLDCVSGWGEYNGV
jgi:hypothetical protein